MPWEAYKANWLDMLSQSNYFNQCPCEWCLKLKHHTTVLMNYLRVAWDLKSFDAKCPWYELQEGIELYTDYFHCKLSCDIILDVCESISATAAYWNPWHSIYEKWYNLIKI